MTRRLGIENWQSIVLLTTGKPQLADDNITRRLARWTGCTFSGSEDDSENFVVLGPQTGMIKLAGEFLFAVTVLERSYFDSEDARPYLEQAGQAGDEHLAGLLRSCRGAIIIDAHIIERPYESLLYLAKTAAAMMEQDTPVMLVPPSLVVRAVSGELRSAMGRANDAAELMPHVMNFSAAPEARDDRLACSTLGMDMLTLPNVIMHCGQEQEDVEQCAAAVQSLATYMVKRRQAVSVGDTTEVGSGGMGFLRVVPATMDGRAQDPQDAVALEPTAGGDARTAPPATPPAGPAGELGNLAKAVTASRPRVARIKARKERAAAKMAAIVTGIVVALYVGSHLFRSCIRQSSEDRKTQQRIRMEQTHRELEKSAAEVRNRLQQDRQTPAPPGSPQETGRQYWIEAQKRRQTTRPDAGAAQTDP